jgi:tetratricopeptide (TPR) repeat protein
MADERSQSVPAEDIDRRILFALFLLACGLRLGYLYQNMRNPLLYQPVLDETYYIGLGKAIAGGFILGERRIFFMDPLYGYFLGALFCVIGKISAAMSWRMADDSLLMIVRAIQIIIDSAIVYLIYRLGVMTWSRRAGLLAALFWAGYKVAFFFSLLILKASFSVFLLLWFVIMLIRAAGEDRPAAWLKVGLMAGILTFTHANLLLMAPLGLLAWSGVKRPDVKRLAAASALVGVGLFLVLSIGAIRNHAAAGEWVFLNSQSGRLLFASNNPENLTGRFQAPSFSRKGPETMDADFAAEAQRRLGRKLSAREVSAYWTGETVKFFISQPAMAAEALWNKLKGTIGDYEIPVNRSYGSNARFSSIARAPLPNFAFALALGAPGLLLGWWMRKETWWLAAPVCAILATLMIFYTSGRFRFPMVPFLLIGAGIFLDVLIGWAREKKWINVLGMAAVAAGLFAVSMSIEGHKYRGDEEYFLAKAYWNVGEYKNAMHLARQGALEFPGESRFLVVQGMVALSQNQLSAAASINREALKIDPQDYDAMNNLGLALAAAGQPEEAAQWLGRAYEGNEKPISLFGLARALEGKGDKAGAIEAYRKFMEIEKPGAPYIAQAQGRIKALGEGR